MYRIPPKPLKSDIAPAVLGAIISGASAIGSGAMSISNSNKQHERQLEYMDKSIDANIQQWNRENDYNLPLKQMQRFKDAGLNPNLIYGQSNTANGMNPSVSVPEAKMPQNAVEQGVQAYNSTRLMDAQIENIQADTDKKKVEAGNSTEMVNIQRELAADTKKKTDAYVNDLIDKQKLRGVRAELYRSTMNKFESEIQLNISKILLNEKNAQLLDKDIESYDTRLEIQIKEANAKINELYARAGLEREQAANLRRDLDEKIATFKMRCNKLKSEYELNNATAEEKRSVAEKLTMEAVALGGDAVANLNNYLYAKDVLEHGYPNIAEQYAGALVSTFTGVLRSVFGFSAHFGL